MLAKPFSNTLSFKGRFPHIVNASIYDAGHVQKNCREIKISNTIKNILRLIVGLVVVNIMVHTLSESVAIYWHENDAIRQI